MKDNNTEQNDRNLKFVRIGGSYQPVISGSSDFSKLIELDDAHWQVTSLTVSSLRTDKRFLDFLDTDRNGLIRTDEVRAALNFMHSVFSDFSGTDAGSDVLKLDAVNRETPDGSAVYAAAQTILLALGKSEASEISLGEIANDAGVRCCATSNGDGIITADPENDPGTAALIAAVSGNVGSVQDLSGVPGMNAAELDAFIALVKAYFAWLDDGKARAEELSPFGENTSAMAQIAGELQEPIRQFFLSSSALAFLEDDPERLAKKGIVADVRSATEVDELLKSVAIAAPEKDGRLRCNAPLNPKWKGKFLALCAYPEFSRFLEDNSLAAEKWQEFTSLLAPCTAYLAANPAAGKFAGLSREDLERLVSDETVSRARELIQSDIDAGNALAGSDKLLKAVLYQKYILEFLNNFANLTDLFKTDCFSMLQTGTLVMDGRHFTLAVPVTNIAEHKKIVSTSNICVAYVEITGGNPGAVQKSTLAVGVTSGSMRNLFVGKRGVFFSADGKVYDAKVTDFIEQPVSISDAVKKPFLSFGSFVGKQFDKLIATHANSVQKDLGTQISTGKVPAVPAAPAGGQVNGSMLLMGGGIGLAALGSSVAFIAKSLQNVSLLTVLGVLLGIMVVFGGPCVVISITKLYRRDLARFLEAAGCALNHSMRLTFILGLFFTFSPRRPGAVGPEMLEDKVTKRSFSCPVVLLLILLSMIIGGAAGIWLGGKVLELRSKCESDRVRQECVVKEAKTAAVKCKNVPAQAQKAVEAKNK